MSDCCLCRTATISVRVFVFHRKSLCVRVFPAFGNSWYNAQTPAGVAPQRKKTTSRYPVVFCFLPHHTKRNRGHEIFWMLFRGVCNAALLRVSPWFTQNPKKEKKTSLQSSPREGSELQRKQTGNGYRFGSVLMVEAGQRRVHQVREPSPTCPPLSAIARFEVQQAPSKVGTPGNECPNLHESKAIASWGQTWCRSNRRQCTLCIITAINDAT